MPVRCFVVLAVLALGPALLPGQISTESTQTLSCTLKNEVYVCDAATFQKRLAEAKSVSIETHSVDKLAYAQLHDLLAKKLAKTVVADGAAADLVFLLIPVKPGGVNMDPGEVPLGALQVYAGNPDGSRGGLLWAESFTGQEDLPWPAVVHSLIARFQARFHIK